LFREITTSREVLTSGTKPSRKLEFGEGSEKVMFFTLLKKVVHMILPEYGLQADGTT